MNERAASRATAILLAIGIAIVLGIGIWAAFQFRPAAPDAEEPAPAVAQRAPAPQVEERLAALAGVDDATRTRVTTLTQQVADLRDAVAAADQRHTEAIAALDAGLASLSADLDAAHSAGAAAARQLDELAEEALALRAAVADLKERRETPPPSRATRAPRPRPPSITLASVDVWGGAPSAVVQSGSRTRFLQVGAALGPWTVTAVDAEAQTMTVTGPRGATRTLHAER